MTLISEIATYTDDIDRSVEQLMEAGLGRWVRDRVEAGAYMDDPEHQYPPELFVARMAFNYDLLDGMCWEFIQPDTGLNYIDRFLMKPGDIAHYGIHVDVEEEVEDLVQRLSLTELVQEMWTVDHANPALEDRSFYHRIYHSERILRPVKLVMKVPREGALAYDPRENGNGG